MFERVLIPTDLSLESDKIFDYALNLSGIKEVVAIHSVEASAYELITERKSDEHKPPTGQKTDDHIIHSGAGLRRFPRPCFLPPVPTAQPQGNGQKHPRSRPSPRNQRGKLRQEKVCEPGGAQDRVNAVQQTRTQESGTDELIQVAFRPVPKHESQRADQKGQHSGDQRHKGVEPDAALQRGVSQKKADAPQAEEETNVGRCPHACHSIFHH